MREAWILAAEAVSPLGETLEKHLAACFRAESGSGIIKGFDVSAFPSQIGCEVTADLTDRFNSLPVDFVPRLQQDRKAELLIACLMQFLPQLRRLSSLSGGVIPIRLGVGHELPSDRAFYREGPVDFEAIMFELTDHSARAPRFNVSLDIQEWYAEAISNLSGISGPRSVNLSACVASTMAIGEAIWDIESGYDYAIVGGVDSVVGMFAITVFTLLDMLSKRNDDPLTASRPFDAHRDGFVPGEGAGLMILGSRQGMDAWGEPPVACITGYGSSLDAWKVTAPHPEGLGAELAIRRALHDADRTSDEIDYVNAHGTSTPLNDIMEYTALSSVFSSSLERVPVSSTKSQIGHLIGAAGIIETITTAYAISRQLLPPSINLMRQDPQIRLRIPQLPNHAANLEIALKQNFALAGQNAALILEHPRVVRL